MLLLFIHHLLHMISFNYPLSSLKGRSLGKRRSGSLLASQFHYPLRGQKQYTTMPLAASVLCVAISSLTCALCFFIPYCFKLEVSKGAWEDKQTNQHREAQTDV